MVHANATQNIKQKISDVISHCVIKDNWPEFYSVNEYVIELSKEVLKHYGRWLTESTLWDIIYDRIRESLSSKFPPKRKLNALQAVVLPDDTEKISGLLTDILGQETATNLEDLISNLIASIPRQYNIYIPLPNVLNLNTKYIHLSDEIAFLKFDKTDTPPGGKEELTVNQLLSPLGSMISGTETKFKVDTSYIAIRVNGYIHGYIDEITFIESLSKFKQIMQMGIILKLFKKTFTTTRRTSYAPREGLNAIIIDMEMPNDISSVISLPNNIVPFANNIALSSASIKDLQTLNHGESTIIGYFKEKLAIPIKIISAPDENADTKSIKTAVEWAFDSSLEQNETISFMQTCIGIEAILGEETGRESLTETLADRCAYLLAKTIGARKIMRNEFRKLYKLRSKIVHGRIINLNDKEQYYLDWGKRILGLIIEKEISLLKL
jgi:hypothetical protein